MQKWPPLETTIICITLEYYTKNVITSHMYMYLPTSTIGEQGRLGIDTWQISCIGGALYALSEGESPTSSG